MKTTILILSIILLFFSNFVLAKTINGKPRIIDGDTIHIKSNKIRLHGIDAPETKQTCKINDEVWFCGKQSTKELKNLINKQEVKCITNDVDIYNRFVAICYVNEININQWMVKSGWAIAYRYYSTDYIIEEKYARDNELGIWKSEFLKPYAYRKQNKN
tara:strand:+ start:19 stop:495 length:477 start_codon:yes stop_codon:yes gene_type:complete